MIKPILLLPLSVLAACSSGGSSGPVTLSDVSDSVGGAPAEVSRDPDTGNYTVVVNDMELTLSRFPLIDDGTFEGALGGPDGEYGLVTSEGDNSVVTLFFADDAIVSGGPSINFARLGEDILPDVGTANLTGDYYGTLSFSVDGEPSYLIDGVVTLTLDFDEKTLNGAITDRVLVDVETFDPIPPAIATVADMTLTATIDKTGGFSGTIADGGITVGSTPPILSEGTFVGLIADGGNEVVGGIEVLQGIAGGGGAFEVGAFAAGH